MSRGHLGEDPYSILSLLEPQLHLGHHLLCPPLLSPSLSPEEPSPAPPKSQGTRAKGTIMVRIPAVALTASSPQLTAEVQLGPQPSPQEVRRGRRWARVSQLAGTSAPGPLLYPPTSSPPRGGQLPLPGTLTQAGLAIPPPMEEEKGIKLHRARPCAGHFVSLLLTVSSLT